MPVKPRVVLSASAIGYYGDHGDEPVDEQSAPGSGFLASVVRDWEGAAAPVGAIGVRLVLLRTGIVLARDGGALAKLLKPFQFGLGGPIGAVHQSITSISLHDPLPPMHHALFP